MENNEYDALLKEYESLRQEITEHQNRREQLFIFTITALGVVMWFAVQTIDLSFMIVSFIPYFIIFNFCRMVHNSSEHIITIGTYIRHFIANRYKYALNWEKIWDDFAAQGDFESSNKKVSDYWAGGGYFYNFCVVATIGVFFGIVGVTLFTDKFESMTLNSIIPFTIFQLFACFWCLYFGVRKIHRGRLNKNTRLERNKLWKNYIIDEQSSIHEIEEA